MILAQKHQTLAKEAEEEKKKWVKNLELINETPDVPQDDEGKECIICGELNKDAVFLPCSHNCTCHECAVLHFNGANCPMCRQKIKQIIRIYS